MSVFAAVSERTGPQLCGECRETTTLSWCLLCKRLHPRRFVCRYCRRHHVETRHGPEWNTYKRARARMVNNHQRRYLEGRGNPTRNLYLAREVG